MIWPLTLLCGFCHEPFLSPLVRDPGPELTVQPVLRVFIEEGAGLAVIARDPVSRDHQAGYAWGEYAITAATVAGGFPAMLRAGEWIPVRASR